MLVSAAFSPVGLVEVWRGSGFELVVSEALLGELRDVLLHPKFRRYLAEEEVLEYVERFGRRASVVPDPLTIPGVTPDPKDDYLVALARSSGADFLVSGDPHLTTLDEPSPRCSPRGPSSNGWHLDPHGDQGLEPGPNPSAHLMLPER